MTHFEHDSNHLLPRPWSSPTPHFQNNAPHAPDVNLKVVTAWLCIDDLWRHPENRSLHSGESAPVDIVSPFRDAEIGYLADTRHFNKDIVRFQILKCVNTLSKTHELNETYSMKNTLGMKVLEATEDLARERDNHILVELPMLVQAAANRSARNIFQKAEAKLTRPRIARGQRALTC